MNKIAKNLDEQDEMQPVDLTGISQNQMQDK
jgi:hypothetical protein